MRGRNGIRGAWVGAAALALGALAWFLDRPRAPGEPLRTPGAEGSPVSERDLDGTAPAPARDPVPATPELASGCVPVLVSVRTREIGGHGVGVGGIDFAVGFGEGRDPAAEPLVRGVTGEDGTAEVELPAPELAEAVARGARLWARIEAPGYPRGTNSIAARDAPGSEIELVARRGFSLAGRVTDEARRPLSAEVRAWQRDEYGNVSGRATSWSTQDGWFELGLPEAVTVDVLAVAEGAGTGLVKDLMDAPGDAVPRPIEIVVRGPGVLRGRVLDPGGGPAAGLELVAASTELAGASLRERSPRALAERRAGAGCLWAEGRTDLEGRFELTGLQAGRYTIHAAREIPLTAAPVPADGQPLSLTLGRPHLVVRVRDLAGQPWTPDPEALRDDPRRRVRWPTLTCVLVALDASEPGAEQGRLLRGRIVDDATVFEVEDGRRYTVGLLGGAQPWRPVPFVAGPGYAELELRQAPETGMGTVTVEALDGEDRAPSENVELRVESPGSGLALGRWDTFWESPWPQTLTLPAGSWRVVVAGRAVVDGWHGNLIARREHGLFEQEVTVRPDQETRVRARLPGGARLALEVCGEPAPQDLRQELVVARGQPEPSRRDVAWVALRLVAPGRWPVPVAFDQRQPIAPLLPRLELGTRGLSELLPAGRWTLEGRLPGGRQARATVELLDGATTAARLDFD